MTSVEWLIEGRVELRRADGAFDELVVWKDGECLAHAEMLSDDCLWIGFYPDGPTMPRVVMRVTIDGKLSVAAEKD